MPKSALMASSLTSSASLDTALAPASGVAPDSAPDYPLETSTIHLYTPKDTLKLPLIVVIISLFLSCLLLQPLRVGLARARANYAPRSSQPARSQPPAQLSQCPGILPVSGDPNASVRPAPRVATGVLRTLIRTWNTEDIRGLFRGVRLTLVRRLSLLALAHVFLSSGRDRLHRAIIQPDWPHVFPGNITTDMFNGTRPVTLSPSEMQAFLADLQKQGGMGYEPSDLELGAEEFNQTNWAYVQNGTALPSIEVAKMVNLARESFYRQNHNWVTWSSAAAGSPVPWSNMLLYTAAVILLTLPLSVITTRYVGLAYGREGP